MAAVTAMGNTSMAPPTAFDAIKKSDQDSRLLTPSITPPKDNETTSDSQRNDSFTTAPVAIKEDAPAAPKLGRPKRKSRHDRDDDEQPPAPTKKPRTQQPKNKASSRLPSVQSAATKTPATKTPTTGNGFSTVKKPSIAKKSPATKKQTKKSTITNAPAVQPPLPEKVHHKLAQVKTLIHHNPTSMLRRATDGDHDMIRIPELTLLGAIMAMRMDYNHGSQFNAEIPDVEDVILERYTGPVGPSPNQALVIIDVSKPSSFEQEIRAKLGKAGEEVEKNLLEAELEMMVRRQTKTDYEHLMGVSDPATMRAKVEEIVAKMLAKSPPREE